MAQKKNEIAEKNTDIFDENFENVNQIEKETAHAIIKNKTKTIFQNNMRK